MARNLNIRSSSAMRRTCVVEITEQPAPKQQRFRYASEVDGSRSVGSIPGKHSTPERKTYPTIRVLGYKGPMVVMLSLVNPEDNLVHPHAITGNDPRYHCTNGVIYTFVDGPEVIFNNVGVLCVKSKTEEDVTTALRDRQNLNIDPFKAGFPHIDDHRLIDFNAVRLCFTVYIPSGEIQPQDRKNLSKYNIDLEPVASTIVYDAKKLSELKIQYINKTAGSMAGGTEMVILCEKYTGANPEVVFVDGEWEAKGEVTMNHKQTALVVISPPYRDTSCTRSATVEVYLQRLSPRGVLERSAPASSEYIPVPPKSHPSEVGVKRPPPDYLEIKGRKKPFKDHLNQFMQNESMQRALEQLMQAYEPPPSTNPKYQELADLPGTSSNVPVQQENMYWPQNSNPFHQQISSNVNDAVPNLYGVNNAVTPGYHQNIDSDSPNATHVNGFDPIMPNVLSYNPLVHNGPTFFNTNNNTMLTNNFTTMPPVFTTFLTQEEVNINLMPTTPNPMPNIIPTASTSCYNQMPDVLSPMSQDCGSLDTDTKFNTALREDHFNIFSENAVSNPEFDKNRNGETLENAVPGMDVYPTNFCSAVGFDDMESLSDELKKINIKLKSSKYNDFDYS